MIKNAQGVHCIMEMRGCPFHLLDDEALIRESMIEAARQSMSTLLQISSHKFEPMGVTALALLAESHISIHTWPELGYAAVDIFTCGDTSDPRLACRHIVEQLKAESHSLLVVPRGSCCEPSPLSVTSPQHTVSADNAAQETETCMAQS